MRIVSCTVKFEPRDAWVGLYWDVKKRGAWRHKRIELASGKTVSISTRARALHIYLCLLPFLVIHAEIHR